MPYAPTVQDRTGEFLMRGITGAADSLADAMKERKQKSQKAASLRKTIGVYNPEMKDEVQTMGLADLEGYVAGIGMKAAKDKLAQEQANQEQDFNLRKAYFDLQKGNLARATERDAAGRRFMASLAELGQDAGRPSMDFSNTLAGEPGSGEISLVKMLQAGRQSGIGPEQLAELAPIIRAEQMGQRQGLAVDPTPVPFSAGGLSGVFSPKTGQFQVDKPEPNPKDARMTVVLERDDMDRPTRTWTGSPKQYEEQFGKPMGGAAGEGKPITREVAADFLKQAGGDKNKARELARKAGYTF